MIPIGGYFRGVEGLENPEVFFAKLEVLRFLKLSYIFEKQFGSLNGMVLIRERISLSQKRESFVR